MSKHSKSQEQLLHMERMRDAKRREDLAFRRRARLAKRDLDYAESPCAARVTVEERGNIVVETRGRCCIAPRITHLGKC